ncbi:hypothetical protein D3C78_1652740 [compost metagenome]
MGREAQHQHTEQDEGEGAALVNPLRPGPLMGLTLLVEAAIAAAFEPDQRTGQIEDKPGQQQHGMPGEPQQQ